MICTKLSHTSHTKVHSPQTILSIYPTQISAWVMCLRIWALNFMVKCMHLQNLLFPLPFVIKVSLVMGGTQQLKTIDAL